MKKTWIEFGGQLALGLTCCVVALCVASCVTPKEGGSKSSSAKPQVFDESLTPTEADEETQWPTGRA